MSNKSLGTTSGLITALVLGVAASVAGTVVHQTRIAEAPLGVALALGLVFWSASTLRFRARKSAGWVFAGVVAVLLTVFAQEGKDVMIPATELGYTWSYGAIAIAALVAAFPRISKSVWKART